MDGHAFGVDLAVRQRHVFQAFILGVHPDAEPDRFTGLELSADHVLPGEAGFDLVGEDCLDASVPAAGCFHAGQALRFGHKGIKLILLRHGPVFLIIMVKIGGHILPPVEPVLQIHPQGFEIGVNAGQDHSGAVVQDVGKLDVVSQGHLLIFHHGEGVSQAKNGGGLSAQQVNVTGQGIRHEMAEVAILVGVRSQ